MNLFFGIAVNEVNSIINIGRVHHNIKMVNIIQVYERGLMLWLYIMPSPLHNFFKQRPLYKEVSANICEVDLGSHGKGKKMSRHLEHEIMVAIERTQVKEKKEPTLHDIMKMIDLNKTMIERLEQKLEKEKRFNMG